MRRKLRCWHVFGLLPTIFATAMAPRPGDAAGSEREDSPIEVQARGPIHEAFAEPIQYDPAEGPFVKTPPPDPIRELPPAVKPTGAHVVWLPGYWAWDDERNDYLWVGGGWRVPPPRTRWLPGYWHAAEDGYRWTPGFWADANASEIKYLPAPPESAETGPSKPPPSGDHFYVPGHWGRRGDDYVWQAGYWARCKPGWNWAPAHYQMTPAGSVFVPGRWDYPLSQRGLLSAPVVIDPAARKGIRHTAKAVVNLAALGGSFFVRPGYGHDYFGDYYSDEYARAGFQPWYAYQDSGQGYVPEYVYSRWLFSRNDANWDAEMRAAYQARFDRADARPPRTWSATQGQGRSAAGGAPLVVSLRQMLSSKASALPLVQVQETSRTRALALSAHLQTLAAHRAKVEARQASALHVGAETDRPAALNLPRLPSALNGVFGIGAAVSDSVEQSLPGVGGRMAPGTGGRTVPGLRGRVVPGVERVPPGAGGTLPGVERRLPGLGGAPGDD